MHRAYAQAARRALHAEKLLAMVLALPERDRAELASALIASLDGPADADWDETWLRELDRRVADAEAMGETGEDWARVRARILGELKHP